MAYDTTFHKVNSRIDQLGNRTTYTFDASLGDLLTIKDALNGVTTLVWGDGGLGNPPKGLLKTVTDVPGPGTSYAYDNIGNDYRLKTTTDAEGTIVTYTYDDAGSVRTVERPFTGGFPAQTGITTSTYDVMERETDNTDALDHHTTFAYNVLSLTT